MWLCIITSMRSYTVFYEKIVNLLRLNFYSFYSVSLITNAVLKYFVGIFVLYLLSPNQLFMPFANYFYPKSLIAFSIISYVRVW